MNTLAHLQLARPDSGWLAGAILGDFWRGAPDPRWPQRLRQGVILHRRIDSFTDSHPDVLRARARFQPPFRRYAGILLDLWFDHRLARHGAALGVDEPGALTAMLDAALSEHAAHLPPAALRFGRAVVRDRRLQAYRDRAAVARALAWLATRLRHDNPLAHGLEALEPLADEIEQDFLAFWPELLAHAATLKSDWRQFNADSPAGADTSISGSGSS
jgi:acyl carrier protein phosphodiesterase